MTIIPYIVTQWKRIFDILWLFVVNKLFQQSLIIVNEFSLCVFIFQACLLFS